MSDPQIISLSPISGAPGSSVTIHGTGLAAVTGVSLGGLACSVSSSSDTAIVFVVPAAAAAGAADLVLGWTGTVVQSGGFAVTPGGGGPGPNPPGNSNDLIIGATVGAAILLGVVFARGAKHHG